MIAEKRDGEREPLWAVTPDKIEEAVRRIAEAANPLKVILFGSRARGSASPESDLDLLVETDDAAAVIEFCARSLPR